MEDKEVFAYGEELLRLVEEFRSKIREGTSDANNFLTITDIEHLWSELRGSTSSIYSDMLTDLLAEIDETELIHKKKLNIEKKE